jgi:hypothetical protein
MSLSFIFDFTYCLLRKRNRRFCPTRVIGCDIYSDSDIVVGSSSISSSSKGGDVNYLNKLLMLLDDMKYCRFGSIIRQIVFSFIWANNGVYNSCFWRNLYNLDDASDECTIVWWRSYCHQKILAISLLIVRLEKLVVVVSFFTDSNSPSKWW